MAYPFPSCRSPMPRYKLLVEYDGTPYAGWQRQANGRAVQQVVEEAILAFCGEDLRIQCAGRTDAGMHATGGFRHAGEGPAAGTIAELKLAAWFRASRRNAMMPS